MSIFLDIADKDIIFVESSVVIILYSLVFFVCSKKLGSEDFKYIFSKTTGHIAILKYCEKMFLFLKRKRSILCL